MSEYNNKKYESKHSQNIFHVIINANVMVENVIQIKRGVTFVSMSV